MRKKPFFNGPSTPNTFIGGAGATTVTSAGALANKLSVSRWHIKNFQIDSNNNVSCYINRNYTMNSSAFSLDNNITYFIDIPGNCTYLNNQCFHNNTNGSPQQILVFPNVTGCNHRICSGGGAGTRNDFGILCFPKLEPLGTSGTTSNDTFSWADFISNVYINDICETNNAGGVDQDLVPAGVPNTGLVSSNVLTYIKYSTNANAPSSATGLYTISATTTSIDLGWNAVTHSNAIDYYVVFADGVFKGSPNTTSLNTTGLASGTTYEFKILVIDGEGNNSNFSNVYSGSTL